MTHMPPVFGVPRRRRRPTGGLPPVPNWALGMALGALVGASLLLFDVLGLRSVFGRAGGALAFVGGSALAFGALGAVIPKSPDDDDEPRGGRRALAFAAAPRRAR